MKRPDSSEPGSVRYRLRKKRFKLIESLLDEILAQRGRANILDIGGRRDYWKLLDPRFADKVSITVLNIRLNAAAAAQQDIGLDITEVVGDGCAMPQYDDGSFDLAHSNSVIEHVGPLHRMADFADETRRIGKAYYLQTPNFWFPLEPHYGVPFFHWLPEATRAALHSRYRIGYLGRQNYRQALRVVDHTKIINRNLLRELFPDGEHKSERIALMAKSLLVYRRLR